MYTCTSVAHRNTTHCTILHTSRFNWPRLRQFKRELATLDHLKMNSIMDFSEDTDLATDTDDTDSEWTPVVRYEHVETNQKVRGSTANDTVRRFQPTVTKRKPVLCTECTDRSERDTVGCYARREKGLIHESQLQSNGTETRCETCEQIDCDPRQVRQSQYTKTIGPVKDTNRERYPNSDRVVLNGAYPYLDGEID
jgi:hypothetical protein